MGPGALPQATMILAFGSRVLPADTTRYHRNWLGNHQTLTTPLSSVMDVRMLSTIDVNCDMGEHAALDPDNHDLDILPFVSSCNVGCGAHGGDLPGIIATVQAAMAHDVAIGAHPSYPDRERFGRVTMTLPRYQLMASLREQIGRLRSITKRMGTELRHVKPHGALYHDVAHDAELADAFVALVKHLDPALLIIGMAGTHLDEICGTHGVRFVPEGFLDRRYAGRNRLQPRTHPAALLEAEDAVLSQLAELLAGHVTDHDGNCHSLQVATVCLHGDAPAAPRLAKRVHDFLQDHHVALRPA